MDHSAITIKTSTVTLSGCLSSVFWVYRNVCACSHTVTNVKTDQLNRGWGVPYRCILDAEGLRSVRTYYDSMLLNTFAPCAPFTALFCSCELMNANDIFLTGDTLGILFLQGFVVMATLAALCIKPGFSGLFFVFVFTQCASSTELTGNNFSKDAH